MYYKWRRRVDNRDTDRFIYMEKNNQEEKYTVRWLMVFDDGVRLTIELFGKYLPKVFRKSPSKELNSATVSNENNSKTLRLRWDPLKAHVR